MGDALPIPPPGFEGLSTEEKIEYVQSLWDHIASDAEAVPLSDWQRKVVDERLKAFQSSPDSGVPWETVRADILQRIRKGS